MTGAEPLVGVALGLGLGARHALEPDHLAAVSVLSADGPSPRRGALIGALWGAGHTLSLLACGLGVALAAERMPPRLSDTFEIGVAAMLVFLGGRAVLRSMHETPRGRPVAHRHRHRAGHVRPLVVGAVHGLAGSGALTALVIARLSDTGARLLFMLLFGLGSVAAMSAISGVAGWPLARLARSPAASRVLLAVTGAMSALFGVLYAFLVARGRLQ
jgi:hypothetical protein